MSIGTKRVSDTTTLVSSVKQESSSPSSEQANSTDAKKAKLNGSPTSIRPSRVIHLRNIPGDTTEAEILYLGLLFSCPTNVLVMRGTKKHQAFLEMPDEASSIKLLSYYSQYPAVIRGREVFMQFSTYQKLNVDEKQAANVAALVQVMASSAAVSGGFPVGLAAAAGQMEHPVAAHPLGVPFVGNGLAAAAAAAAGLNPSALVAAAFTEEPSGSTDEPAEVEEEQEGGGGEEEEMEEKEKSEGDVETSAMVASTEANASVGDGDNGPGASEEPSKPILCVIVENMMVPVSIDLLHYLFSDFGEVLRIVSFYKNNQYHALLEYRNALMASAAKATLNGRHIYNGCCQLKISYSKFEKLEVRHNSDKAKDFTKEPTSYDFPLNAVQSLHLTALQQGNSLPFSSLLPSGPYGLGAGGGGSAAAVMGPAPVAPVAASHLSPSAIGATMPSVGIQQPGSVVIVSNLNEHVVTPSDLFILFGVYGMVMRVKIMFNKRDTALIQFADSLQARLAIQHLNGVVLYGKEMRINISKHAVVQLPREGVDRDSHLTQDYSHSKAHRYSRTGVDVRKIYPPGQTLHLSNIPASDSDEAVRDVFLKLGFSVEKFQRFKGKENDENYRKMALIQLTSTEDAVQALIKVHNHQQSDGHRMRVSFAKNSTIHPTTV
ncbi:polypyrimidine tract-binding protein 3-like isoform X2 [Oscarella lobularis]|uniref:polypyrimidine tract-binding protein 3-like isoform X2 n=1 Tax=Oscarella lobularis TaxID=121494 RepID=UPI003313F1AF